MVEKKEWTIFVCPLHPELYEQSWRCRIKACSAACEPVRVREAPRDCDDDAGVARARIGVGLPVETQVALRDR